MWVHLLLSKTLFLSTPEVTRFFILRGTFSRLFGIISDFCGVYWELAISIPPWIQAELGKILTCVLKFFPFPQILISRSEFLRRGGYVRALYVGALFSGFNTFHFNALHVLHIC